jgi:hypothetical protein
VGSDSRSWLMNLIEHGFTFGWRATVRACSRRFFDIVIKLRTVRPSADTGSSHSRQRTIVRSRAPERRYLAADETTSDLATAAMKALFAKDEGSFADIIRGCSGWV